MMTLTEKRKHPIETSSSSESVALMFLLAFLGIHALSSITIGFSLPVFLATVVPAVLFAFLYPRSGLAAVIVTTVLFERFFTLQPIVIGEAVYKAYPLDFILLAVFASLIFRHFLNPDRRSGTRLGHIEWLFTSFFGFVSVVFLASVSGYGNSDAAVAFSTWKNYVFYGSVLFAVASVIRTTDDLRSFAKLLLVSSGFALIFLLVGVARGGGIWTEYTPLSTFGTRLVAFPHAFYYSLSSVILLYSSWWWLREKRSHAGPMLLLLGLFCFGILGSLMRHLWLSVGISVIVFLLLAPSFVKSVSFSIIRRAAFITAIGGAMLLLGFGLFSGSDAVQTVKYDVSVVTERALSFGNTSDESFRWRDAVWRSALSEFAPASLIGMGFGGSVPVEIGSYRDFVEMRNMHNSWLGLLLQTGIVGFGLFFAGTVSAFHAMFRLRGRKSLVGTAALVVTGLLVLQGLAFLSQPYLETNLLGMWFWITIGVSVSVRRISRIDKDEESYAHS